LALQQVHLDKSDDDRLKSFKETLPNDPLTKLIALTDA
jgi:hypothetical protein